MMAGLELNGVVTSDRGDEPGNWTHSVTRPQIPMTWHHTIPWNRLRDTWNGLVRAAYWDGVDQFLQLISAPNVATVINQIKAGALDGRNELFTLLTWQGWNIVEGPGGAARLAGDDPEDQLDNWSGLGMTSNQKSTLQAVKVLNLEMEAFVAATQNGGVPSATQLKKITTALSTAKAPLRGKQPMPWNEDMWTKVTVGVVNKTAPAVWDRMPVYRRRTE
jgi:hypothetical protein